MERELALLILSAALCSASVWAAAVGVHRPLAGRTSSARERELWWRLMGPVIAAGLVLAFLVGWALQETDPTDERMNAWWVVPALLAGLVVLRAAARALWSVRSARRAEHLIATVGFLQPRVVVSARFGEALSPAEQEAALAHERAHARSFDPLRVWLAQLACDLQWPAPGARARFDAWLAALEMRRDVEAVTAGASPLDLAAAIVSAARSGAGRAQAAAAHLTPRPSGVEARVRELLALPAEGPPPAPRALVRLVPLALSAAFLLAVLLGTHLGAVVLRALPGIGVC